MIETQPVPPHIATALAVLNRVSPDDPDMEPAADAVTALGVLTSCRPLYPPLPGPTDPPVPAAEAITQADAALELAIGEARSAEEAVRCAIARRALRGDMDAASVW